MSDELIDYLKYKKSKAERTIEEALLAFCKVIASNEILPLSKETGGERVRLKNARSDIKDFLHNQKTYRNNYT